MDKVKRGKKHICFACMCIFYDLNKDIALCPKCGKEQISKKPITQNIDNKTTTINEEEVIEDNNLEEEVPFDDIDKNIAEVEEDL